MRGLFRWAVDVEIAELDPTRDVKLLNVKTDGFHVWTDDEAARFEARWPIGTRERLAFDLLLFTGLRRGDAVRLGRQHIKDGVFRIKTEKNGVVVEAPVLPPLARSVDAAPTGDLAFIAGERGKPMTKESFGNWFREACQSAGVPGSAHGLRKAGATRAAENGATTTETQGDVQVGLTTTMPAHYTKTADRARVGGWRHVEVWNGKRKRARGGPPYPLTWAKRQDFSTKPKENKAMAPRAGLEPATIRLTVDWAKTGIA